MKASKLLTKKQRQMQYGIYIAFDFKNLTFEQFLIQPIRLSEKQVKSNKNK